MIRRALLIVAALTMLAVPVSASEYTNSRFARRNAAVFKTARDHNRYRQQTLFLQNQDDFVFVNFELYRLYRYPVPQGFWLGERGIYR